MHMRVKLPCAKLGEHCVPHVFDIHDFPSWLRFTITDALVRTILNLIKAFETIMDMGGGLRCFDTKG